MVSDEKVAEALNEIASALYQLGNGNAATPMGGLEAHGLKLAEAIEDAAIKLSGSLDGLADAVRQGKEQ